MKVSPIPFAVALAVLSCAGGAHAQSGASGTSVTMFGVLDAGVGRYKGAATGVTSADVPTWRQDAGNLTTSFWGLRGTEDLGGGLSALFSLESFLRNDTGQFGRSDAVTTPAISVTADPFWSKAAWVGLDSKTLGRIRLGQITTAMWISSVRTNAFGDSTAFSPINLLMFINAPSILSGGTGWSNSVSYETPTVGGFNLNLQGSLGENSGGNNLGGRLSYISGPLETSFAYTSVKTDPLTFSQGTSKSNNKNTLFAIAYDFKAVKLFAHLGQIKTDGSNTPAPADNNVTHRIWDISALLPIGVGQVMAGYGQRKGNETLSPHTQRRVASLGYTYSLSKRTDLYALMRFDRTTTQNPPSLTTTTNASGTSYAVGMRHAF
ncbi:MAG: porin [Pseudomonadota bacterium]